MNNIIGIDIGLNGGISDGTLNISMPTSKIEIEPPTYKQVSIKGKKQFYKNGKPKMKLAKKAKFNTILDVETIKSIFKLHNKVVLEKPGTSKGNSARSSSTTNINFGILLGIAQCEHLDIYLVPPSVWKKDLGLSKDKLESVELAEKLSGIQIFRSKKGALYDGIAEAYLIWYWFNNVATSCQLDKYKFNYKG